MALLNLEIAELLVGKSNSLLSRFPTNASSTRPCPLWPVNLLLRCNNSVLSASDRGNTLKNIEKECNAKIMIRGKGSVKEGKVGRKDGQMLPGEDEPLHALVTANTMENVKKAVEQVRVPERKPPARNLGGGPGASMTVSCISTR